MPRNLIKPSELENILEESSQQPYESCLSHLRDRMNEYGYKFPNNRRGEKMAYVTARNIRIKNSDALRQNYSEDIGSLPGSVVEKNGVKYVIHGISHGLRGVSKSLSALLKTEAAGWVEEGGAVVFEQNLMSFCGFDKYTLDYNFYEEVKDHKALGWDGNLYLILLSMPPTSIARSMLTFTLPFLGGRASKNMVRKTFMSFLDSSYIRPLRDALLETYMLPEPLQINFSSDFISPIKSTTLRSAYIAKEVLKKARKGYDTVHLIVGLTHEPEIKYFLEKGTPQNLEINLQAKLHL